MHQQISESSEDNSWRITDTPNMPSPLEKNNQRFQAQERPFSAKYHHYESIESSSGAPLKSKKIGDPEIKQLYRELRPGSNAFKPSSSQTGNAITSSK